MQRGSSTALPCLVKNYLVLVAGATEDDLLRASVSMDFAFLDNQEAPNEVLVEEQQEAVLILLRQARQ